MVRLSIIAFILIGLLACGNAQSQSKQLTALQFSEQLQQQENAQLIDVRTAEEYSKGHLAQSKNIDWNEKDFSRQVESLDKEQPIFVYCQGGGRSAAATNKLNELGFKHVYDMQGGIMAWRAANLEEARSDAAVTGMSMDQYQALLKTEKLVLVDFYAEWCVPCKKMKPYLDKIAKDKKLNIEIVRINADEHADLATQLNIDGLPYLKFYKDGTQLWQHLGFMSEKDLRSKITLEKP